MNTSSTPSTASASAVWMRLMRPLAIVDVTTKPYARPGTLYSAAYFATPVTLARPSTRDVGLPQIAGGGHGASVYLIRLSACDCGFAAAACIKARTMPRRASSILKSLRPKLRASRSTVSAARSKLSRVAGAPLSSASTCGSRHGLCATPPSARRASLIRAALYFKTDRDRDQSERIGQAIADLEIGVVLGKTLRRQLDRGDDLITP